jgi:hypothetical protein
MIIYDRISVFSQMLPTFLFSLFSVLVLVNAQSGSIGGDNHEALLACIPDVAQFCLAAREGGLPSIKACLTQHLSELNEECKAAVENLPSDPDSSMPSPPPPMPSPPLFGGDGHTTWVPCFPDVQKFCANEREGGLDAVKPCMIQHLSELAPDCKSIIEEMPTDPDHPMPPPPMDPPTPIDGSGGLGGGAHNAFVPCFPDVAKFCLREREEGRLAVLECMKEHLSELAPDCKEIVGRLPTDPAAPMPPMPHGRFGDDHHEEFIACMPDARKYCGKSMEQGLSAVRVCMKEHWNELSQQCRDTIEKKYAQKDEALKVCGADMDKFCGDYADKGKWRMKQCMRDHLHELSKECLDFIAVMKVGEDKIWRECGSELKKPCMDEAKSGSFTRLTDCIAEHEAELSQKCKILYQESPLVRCRSDTDKLCPQADSLGELMLCMGSNKAKISATCKTSIGAQHETREPHGDRHGRKHGRRDACDKDVTRVCQMKPTRRNIGEVMECLAANVEDLSEQCQRQFKQSPAWMCRDDVAQLCSDEEDVMRCMKDHVRELSDECKRSFKNRHGGRSKHHGGKRHGDDHGDRRGDEREDDDDVDDDDVAAAIAAASQEPVATMWGASSDDEDGNALKLMRIGRVAIIAVPLVLAIAAVICVCRRCKNRTPPTQAPQVTAAASAYAPVVANTRTTYQPLQNIV